MLGILGGFGDGRFNETMQNVVGPTLVAKATKFCQILAIFPQNRPYKSACMPDRPHMFGRTRGDDQGAIFVAMATTFALGAESNRLSLLLLHCFLSVTLRKRDAIFNFSRPYVHLLTNVEVA